MIATVAVLAIGSCHTLPARSAGLSPVPRAGGLQEPQSVPGPATPSPAQLVADERVEQRLRARVAQCVTRWAEAYDDGWMDMHIAIQPAGTGRQGTIYNAITGKDQVLPAESRSHFALLNRIIAWVETKKDGAFTRPLLSLAACGYGQTTLDAFGPQIRQLAVGALVRSAPAAAWADLARIARGPDRSPNQKALADANQLTTTPDEDSDLLITHRVAALQVLSFASRRGGNSTFFSAFEAALLARDPRVRLAAAEAIQQVRTEESLTLASRALRMEDHPVVAQALARKLLLGLGKLELTPRRRLDIAVSAVKHAPRADWATAMVLLDLAEDHRSPDLVETLIRVLESHAVPSDPLVALVNDQASPILSRRAHTLLTRWTGATFPCHQPELWRKQFEDEGGKLELLPDPSKVERDPTRTVARSSGRTQSTFYGIEVVGRNVVFIIDRSGSMKTMVPKPPGLNTSTAGNEFTRLQAATHQTALAVQSMRPEFTFRIIVFSDTAKALSKAPVRAGRSGTSLTHRFGRLRPKGGTNLGDALIMALGDGADVMLEPNETRVDEIFVLTDGNPTVGDYQSPGAILSVVNQLNQYRQARIHTVFTGGEGGPPFLQDLAAQNRGSYVQR